MHVDPNPSTDATPAVDQADAQVDFSLCELRRQIDEIDTAIHELLLQRTVVT